MKGAILSFGPTWRPRPEDIRELRPSPLPPRCRDLESAPRITMHPIKDQTSRAAGHPVKQAPPPPVGPVWRRVPAVSVRAPMNGLKGAIVAAMSGGEWLGAAAIIAAIGARTQPVNSRSVRARLSQLVNAGQVRVRQTAGRGNTVQYQLLPEWRS